MAIPINDVTPRIQYTAAAAQTVFIVPFPFFEDTDLKVYLTPAGDTADDLVDILTYAVDYTVAGAGAENGGTITLLAAASANDIITIVRDMPEERLSLYLQGGLFTAEQVNDDFSMDVMMNQQNEMRITELAPHYNTSANVDSGDILLPVLAANQVWVMNSTATQIIATDLDVDGIIVIQTTSTITSLVSQVAHGLIVGNIVRCSGVNTFVKAQANSAANAEVIGVVSAVADADNFTLQYGGLVSGLAGLAAGSAYYLSPGAAGAYTAVKPVAATQVVKPIFIAISAATAIWTNMLGVVL